MKSFDGKEIYTYLWDQVQHPIGVVQVSHGLGEKSSRYDDFARFLNRNGFIVFASDHRGHGETDRRNGYYCPGDVCGDTVRDLLFFNRRLHENYPNLSLIIFGHSYGSYLVQRFIQCDNYTSVCVLTGTSMEDHQLMATREKLTRDLSIRNPKQRLNLKNKAKTGFWDLKDPNAWLTRDVEVRRKYADDPFVSGASYASFVHSSVKVMMDCTDPANIQNIDPTLPIGIFCGEDDVAGERGKGPKKLLEAYQQYGKNAFFAVVS